MTSGVKHRRSTGPGLLRVIFLEVVAGFRSAQPPTGPAIHAASSLVAPPTIPSQSSMLHWSPGYFAPQLEPTSRFPGESTGNNPGKSDGHWRRAGDRRVLADYRGWCRTIQRPRRNGGADAQFAWCSRVNWGCPTV
jgi:hypothetical protein